MFETQWNLSLIGQKKMRCVLILGPTRNCFGKIRGVLISGVSKKLFLGKKRCPYIRGVPISGIPSEMVPL